MTQQEALIIAGGYRCGTTSLFTYLAAHPEINPSTIKEPAFFYGPRIRQRPSAYPAGREAEAYLSMFEKKSGRVLLDGTANYLGDPGCAARIKAGLPNARVIILLREPVARLVSWYKFLRLQGWLEHHVSFEEWIRAQLADDRPAEQKPYTHQAVAHSFYAGYLAEYLAAFGSDRVLPIWFDDLKRDARAVMEEVCAFAGIAPQFYETYRFPTQNEAMQIRRPAAFAAYRKLHRVLLRPFRRFPMLHHRLRVILFGRIEPAILPLFTAPADPVRVPPALEQELRGHFGPDIAELERTLGRPAPWRRAYQS